MLFCMAKNLAFPENFNNRFQFWNVSLGFGGLSALECNTKNQKKRDRGEKTV